MRLYLSTYTAALLHRIHREERGDVPGWVLVTLMTAGLVVAIWLIAGPLLVEVFESAVRRVAGTTGGA